MSFGFVSLCLLLGFDCYCLSAVSLWYSPTEFLCLEKMAIKSAESGVKYK